MTTKPMDRRSRGPIAILLMLGLLGVAAMAPGVATAGDTPAGTSPPDLELELTKKGDGVRVYWDVETDARQRDRVLEIEKLVHDGVDEVWQNELTRTKVGKRGSVLDRGAVTSTTDYRARLLVSPQAARAAGEWGPVVTVEPLPAPTTTTPTTTKLPPPPPPGVSLCTESWDAQVIADLNRLRPAQHPAREDAKLNAVANERAQIMARNNAMSHGTKGTPEHYVSIVNRMNYHWGSISEVIHVGVSVDDVVTGWKNSPDHNGIIRNTTRDDVGVGCAISISGRRYWAMIQGLGS